MAVKKDWQKAFEDYKAGMSYADIAKKYKVSLPTVRSWQQRHFKDMQQQENDMQNTQNDSNDMQIDMQQDGVRPDTARTEGNTQPSNYNGIDMPPEHPIAKRQITLADIEDVLVDEDYKALEPRQRAFVDEYILNGRNATQAYMKAYGCGRNSAGSSSSDLLRIPKIARIIDVKLAERSAAAHVDIEYVLIHAKEVVARGLQAAPVMIFDKVNKEYVQATDENGNNVWQYDSKGVNQALELIAKIAGLLVDKKQIDIHQQVSDMTEAELDKKIAELEHQMIDVTPQK